MRYFLTTTRYIAQAQAHLLLPFILPHGTRSTYMFMAVQCVLQSILHIYIAVTVHTTPLCSRPYALVSANACIPVTTQSVPSYYPVTTQTIIHV